MSRLAPPLCILAVVLLVAAGCGGRSSKPVYELPPPAPPGEDQPSDEVSENLALALGPAAGSAANLEQRRRELPKELVGDQQNADYSGERLTGSVASTTPAPSPAAVPPAPAAAPAAPEAAPRVAVQSQSVAPAQAPAAPKTEAAPPAPAPPNAPPAPPAPSAPTAPKADVASAATAGQVIAQIAAFRTRANAEGGWQRLRDAYPDLLGDRAMILQEADLGERGVFYRVRTGPFADTAEAEAFCGQLRARDQACVVVNPN